MCYLRWDCACDGKGRPLAMIITLGHCHDSAQLGAGVGRIRVPCPGDGDSHAPSRIGSSLIRATVIRTVVRCSASSRSRTPFLNGMQGAILRRRLVASGRRSCAGRNRRGGRAPHVRRWSAGLSSPASVPDHAARPASWARSRCGPTHVCRQRAEPALDRG